MKKIYILALMILLTISTTGCQDQNYQGLTLKGNNSFINKMQSELHNDRSSSVKTKYIASYGSDTNSGSKTKPFKTINYALKKAKSGDTFYIRGGTYDENIVMDDLNGKSDAYICIKNYDNENVKICSDKAKPLININNCSFIKICGVELYGAKGNNASGITIEGSSDLLITHNKFHDIKVNDASKENANGILMLGDKIKTIENILIYDNHFYDCATGWSECISAADNVKNINIIKNTINDTGNIGIDFAGNYGYCKDSSKDQARDCLAAYNTITDCVSLNATSYGIYVDGGKDIDIINNTVKRCSGGIEAGAEQVPKQKQYSTRKIMIKNNTLINNSENAVSIGGYEKKLGWVKDVLVSGNKCIDSGIKDAILTISKADNIRIINNTFSNSKSSSPAVNIELSKKYSRNIEFDSNTYHSQKGKEKISFIYHGKELTGMKMWKKHANEDNARYK